MTIFTVSEKHMLLL